MLVTFVSLLSALVTCIVVLGEGLGVHFVMPL